MFSKSNFLGKSPEELMSDGSQPEVAPSRRIRRIYLLPNFVTTLSLLSGFFSIIQSIQGRFIEAAWAIVLAGVFDALDGRIARLAKATSAFGVQYDSLSDLVSFGVAPAILLYQWALFPYHRLGVLASFLFLACGALRLARFNVNVEVVSKKYFQGLSITLAAQVVATYVLFEADLGLQSLWNPSFREGVIGCGALGLASLMVSTLPFPSFKDCHWRSRASFGFLMVGILALVLIAVRPELFLFCSAAAYVGGGLLWAAWCVSQPSCQKSPVEQPCGSMH